MATFISFYLVELVRAYYSFSFGRIAFFKGGGESNTVGPIQFAGLCSSAAEMAEKGCVGLSRRRLGCYVHLFR